MSPGRERQTDDKDRKVELQFQPLSIWPLPPGEVVLVLQPTAFWQLPRGFYTLLGINDSVFPFHFLGLPKESVIDTALREPQVPQVRGQNIHTDDDRDTS